MRQTARPILRAMAARGKAAVLAEIPEEVIDLLEALPLYEFL